MTEICKRNLEKLQNKNIDMYDSVLEKLADYQANGFFIDKAKNGEDILCKKIDEKIVCFNSKYNPTNEANKKMQEYAEVCDEAYVAIFGFSTGVFVREFLKINNYGSAIFVFEPCLESFLTVLLEVDISDIIQNPRFFIAVNGINEYYFESFLTSFTNVKNEKNNRYDALDSYKTVFCEEYKQYNQTIQDKLNYYEIQKNTMIVHGREMVDAEIRNMKYFPGCRSAADYVGVFPADMPAIVVSAGPSLQKNVELLKDIKGKAVIIVVDSAINAVMSRGIVPDFVITVDSNKELKNFDVEGLKDVFMLCDTMANPSVLEHVNPENVVFYSTNLDIVKKLFAEEGTSIDELFAGGSVALDAMSVAIYWGFKRIIMIGQDLAMTGNKQYVDDTKNVDSYNSPVLYVKDIYGNDILTKRDYYDYIQNIENLAFRHKDVEFIDASEGGALKKNTIVMTLKKAIECYLGKEYNIKEIIESVPQRFTCNCEEKIKNVLNEMVYELDALSAKMCKATKMCKDAVYMLESRRIDKNRLIEINNYMTELDDIYEKSLYVDMIKKYAAKVNYEFEAIMSQQIADVMQDTLRLYRASQMFYDGTGKAINELSENVKFISEDQEIKFKVSLIIPCYNAEEYVEKCIERLTKQTIGFNNIQVIMVNDGSKDNTYDKLVEMEARYPDNIVAINLEKNMGPSYARNIAVEYVLADYFAFLDVDDWTESDMYEKMYKKMLRNDYDLVLCESDRPTCEEEAKSGSVHNDEVFIIENDNQWKDWFVRIRMSKGPWDKLISKRFWVENNIFFPVGYFYEDTFASDMMYIFAKKIYRMGDVLYHWWRNPNGTTGTNRRTLDRFVVQNMLLDIVYDAGLFDRYKEEIEYNYYENTFVECMWLYFRTGKMSIRTINYMKNKLLDAVPDIMNNPYYLQKKLIANMLDQSLFHCFIEKDVDEECIKEFEADIKEENSNIEFFDALVQIRRNISELMQSGIKDKSYISKVLNDTLNMYIAVYSEYGLKIRGITEIVTVKSKIEEINNITGDISKSLDELIELFTRKTFKKNYEKQMSNMPYAVTNSNSIQFYYDIIKVLNVKQVLDVGGFLKRIGVVSRMNCFARIDEDVWLDAYEAEDAIDYPVYHRIYNHMYKALPEKKYDLVEMLHIQNLWNDEDRVKICEYVDTHSRYVVFGVDDYVCKNYFNCRGDFQYANIGSSTYIVVTLKEK